MAWKCKTVERECIFCEGTGKVKSFSGKEETCIYCKGTGKVSHQECWEEWDG